MMVGPSDTGIDTAVCVIILTTFLLNVGVVYGENKNGALDDNTQSIFGSGNNYGIIAAYGDFNADQDTDVFVIKPALGTDDSPNVHVYLWQDTEPYLNQFPIIINRYQGEIITSVVPGDYNADSKMDILLTIKQYGSLYDPSSPTTVYIYWGNLVHVEANPTRIAPDLADQPLVMDYNADMIPDIFGVDVNGSRTVWLASNSGNFTETLPLAHTKPIMIPHSNAFVDLSLSSKLATDIFITSLKSDDTPEFEFWENSLGQTVPTFSRYQTYDPPDNCVVIGQSAFADIDADGIIDHILPVCKDSECRESSIYYKNMKMNEWTLAIDFTSTNNKINGKIMGFVPPGMDVSMYANVPITLSIGDFDTDRYPDLMVVMRAEDNTRRVVLINNNDGTTFKPEPRMGDLGIIKDPIIAAFVDLSHNTMLDIFIISQDSPEAQPKIHAIKNNFVVDAYFIRVQVLSGLCFSNCPGFNKSSYPYGVNQPGPTVKYTTTGTTGKKEMSIGTQLSQSAYFSLQISSVFMGLGQNPNFVDTVSVGIPTNSTERVTEWTSIIPNSILIVIPQPPTEPSKWDVKLLITPGQSVYLTAGALLGTCLFVAFIVGILHLKERREDEKEKRQESHRFHFDAM